MTPNVLKIEATDVDIHIKITVKLGKSYYAANSKIVYVAFSNLALLELHQR